MGAFYFNSVKGRGKEVPTGTAIRMVGMFLLGIWLFLPFGCVSSLHRQPSGTTVYVNSFENPQDTLSWYWAGDYRLTHDTPPGGGKNALQINGGSVLPTASFITRPVRNGGYFMIECWGKTLDVGGYVELATISDHEITNTIFVSIVEPEWQHVQSKKILYCPPNSSLMLTMQASALSKGAMLVDMIRIQKIKDPEKYANSIEGLMTNRKNPR